MARQDIRGIIEQLESNGENPSEDEVKKGIRKTVEELAKQPSEDNTEEEFENEELGELLEGM